MGKKKLSKSKTDVKLAGVCGGIAEYMEVDPTTVRIVFVLLFIFTGGLILNLYLALMLLLD